MIDPRKFFSTPSAFLESPSTSDAYLLFRPDTGANGFPIGASLAVSDQERALIITDGRIVNTLGPGLYTLDREQLADLAALHSWPRDFSGNTHAELIFVSTAPQPRRVWRTRPGANDPLEAVGTVEVRVTDVQRFAFTQLEKGNDDDEAVHRSVEHAILRELRDLAEEPDWSAARLLTERREFEARLQRRVRTRLEMQGLGDVGVRIRGLTLKSLEAKAAGQPQPEDKPPAIANNVTTIDFDSASVRRAKGATPDATKEDDMLQSLESALDDFERELNDLDAWGSIKPRPSAVGNEVEAAPLHLPDDLKEASFYIAIDMEQTGPFDAAEFEEAVSEGVVTDSTLIWFQGMEDWKPAGEVPEIADLLKS